MIDPLHHGDPIARCGGCPFWCSCPPCCQHPTARKRAGYCSATDRCRRPAAAIWARYEQEAEEARQPAARFMAGDSMEAVAMDLGCTVDEVEAAVREAMAARKSQQRPVWSPQEIAQASALAESWAYLLEDEPHVDRATGRGATR